jgi:hypothetical protein
MSHWAELDEENVVLRVVETDFTSKPELPGLWIETYQDTAKMLNIASAGDLYDEASGTFIPAQPYESWFFSGEDRLWHPPIDMPSDGAFYSWNEASKDWVASGNSA